jgi:hypothetical protein
VAKVFGDWCVHSVFSIEYGSLQAGLDGFRVSHVPTGYSIASLADDMTEADAVAVAKSLNRAKLDVYDSDAVCIAQAAVGAALSEPPT